MTLSTGADGIIIVAIILLLYNIAENPFQAHLSMISEKLGLGKNCLRYCGSGCDKRLGERLCARLGDLKVG